MLSSDKNIEYIGEFVEEAKHWLSLKTEYAKLNTIDKVVRIFTALTLLMVIAFLTMLILIYLSFAVAYALESYVQSLPLGFVCVSAFYLLLLFVVVIKRHAWIEKPMVKFLVSILYDENPNTK